jgi:hypothetical protein
MSRINLTWDDAAKGGTLICSMLAASWILFSAIGDVRGDIALLRSEVQHVIRKGERVSATLGDHGDHIHAHDVRLTVLEATP